MASANTYKDLSRAISLVSNRVAGFESLLPPDDAPRAPVVGITGPPGAGKSTLTDKLIADLVQEKNSVGVLCIDPTSPFTNGAVLGDRIRMSEWYNHPRVFIRSLATRGELGGLPPMSAEILDLMRASDFDIVIVETVGVGQNEVGISSLADLTVVVLVPEGGDDIQFMKAGLMEIADIFVVNKCDRPGADSFVNEVKRSMPAGKPVIKTIANTKYGVGDLFKEIKNHFS